MFFEYHKEANLWICTSKISQWITLKIEKKVFYHFFPTADIFKLKDP